MATSKTLSIGVIGAGMWGKTHIENLRQDGRAEVTWVCSRTGETLRQVQGALDIPRGTLSYQDVLNDAGVDAVVIATPPFTHAGIAVDAMRAGKHVFLEKPLAVTRQEMTRVAAEAEAHPELVILEGSCRYARLQPKFDFVKGMIENGRLGRVYHIHHHHLMQTTFVEYNPKGTWGRSKAEAGGGPLFDWGVYDLAFHLGLLNDAPNLASLQSFAIGGLRQNPNVASDVEEHGAAYMTFDTGLTYYYERGAGVHNEAACETRIYGTRGGLRFSYLPWDSNQIGHFFEDAQGQPQKEILEVDMSHHPFDNLVAVGHFVDCIQGQAEPAMTVPLACKHLDIIMRIVEG